jgi:hypothetical protein
MSTLQATGALVSALTASQVADLMNFTHQLPAIDRDRTWPAVPVFVVATWRMRERAEVVSYCEQRLRNALRKQIPRGTRLGWPGASFPRNLRQWVPTFSLTLHCMAFYELLTPKEFAQKLNLPASWVKDHTRSRVPEAEQIPHVKLGMYTRFEWGSPQLDAWLTAHRKGSKK